MSRRRVLLACVLLGLTVVATGCEQPEPVVQYPPRPVDDARVVEERNVERFDNWRVDEFVNGKVIYKAVSQNEVFPNRRLYVDGAYVKLVDADFRGVFFDFDVAEMRAERMWVEFAPVTKGGKRLVRVKAEGNVMFLSDRDYLLQDEAIEVGLEDDFFHSRGMMKAVMPLPEPPLKF